MSVADEQPEIVFRPSRERFRPVWRYGIASVGALVGGLVVLGLVLSGGDLVGAIGGLAPFLVLLTGALGVVLALDVRPRIVICPDRVVVRRLTWGRVTARSEVGTAVLTTERSPVAGWVSNPETSGVRLYLLRRDGSRMANLAEEYWGMEQFEAITRALAVEVDHVGALTPKQLRRRYKGAVPWTAAHVATTTFLCVIGFIVLCFLIIALVSLGTVVF